MAIKRTKYQYLGAAIGPLLESDRKDIRLSRKEVVKQMGWKNPQYLYAIEKGLRVPSIQIIAKLCEVYKTDPLKYKRHFHDIIDIEWERVVGGAGN